MVKYKILFRFMLSFTILMNSSCIHVSERETKSLTIDSNEINHLLRTQETGSAKIESIAYQPDVLPMEIFFTKLKEGKYKEAIDKIDIKYRPSNTNNKIIYDFLNDGYVPAFVRISNNSTKPMHISLKNFTLVYDDVCTADCATAPRQIKVFNPTALAANTYNFAIVLIITFAILLFLTVVTQGHFPNIPGAGGGGRGSGPRASGSSDKDLFSNLEKTIDYDYGKLLITDEIIESNTVREGLLFFKVGSVSLFRNPRVIFSN